METNSEDVLWTSVMTETKWSQPTQLSSAGHDDLLHNWSSTVCKLDGPVKQAMRLAYTDHKQNRKQGSHYPQNPLNAVAFYTFFCFQHHHFASGTIVFNTNHYSRLAGTGIISQSENYGKKKQKKKLQLFITVSINWYLYRQQMCYTTCTDMY